MSKIKLFLKGNIKLIALIFLLIVTSVYFYMSMILYAISIIDSEMENNFRLVVQYEMSHLGIFIFLHILLVLIFYIKKINLDYLFVFLLVYVSGYFAVIDTLRIFY